MSYVDLDLRTRATLPPSSQAEHSPELRAAGNTGAGAGPAQVPALRAATGKAGA